MTDGTNFSYIDTSGIVVVLDRLVAAQWVRRQEVVVVEVEVATPRDVRLIAIAHEPLCGAVDGIHIVEAAVLVDRVVDGVQPAAERFEIDDARQCREVERAALMKAGLRRRGSIIVGSVGSGCAEGQGLAANVIELDGVDADGSRATSADVQVVVEHHHHQLTVGDDELTYAVDADERRSFVS